MDLVTQVNSNFKNSLINREKIEEREFEILSKFAFKSANSEGEIALKRKITSEPNFSEIGTE